MPCVLQLESIVCITLQDTFLLNLSIFTFTPHTCIQLCLRSPKLDIVPFNFSIE